MTYWYLVPATLVLLGAAGVLYRFSDGGMADGFFATIALFLGLACVLGAICTGAGFVVGNLDRATCVQRGEKTGMYTQFTLLSGCYVRVHDHLVPYDRWVQVSGVNTP